MFVKPLIFIFTFNSEAGINADILQYFPQSLLMRGRERAILPLSLPVCTNAIQDTKATIPAAYLTPLVQFWVLPVPWPFSILFAFFQKEQMGSRKQFNPSFVSLWMNFKYAKHLSSNLNRTRRKAALLGHLKLAAWKPTWRAPRGVVTVEASSRCSCQTAS